MIVGFSKVPQDRWDNIKRDLPDLPPKKTKPKPVRTISIRVDSFPADIQGKREMQTGKILSTRSQYERDLKEMGFEHLQ